MSTHFAQADFITSPSARRVRFFTAAVLLIAAAFAAFAAPRAGAITDAEELTRIGGVGHGSGAGEIYSLGGVASDPVTGHLFVSESGNERISEFTPWGSFVKAFGWDVAPGAVNEQQEVRVRASSGQFKLSFGASTTPDLPYDAGAAQVEAALNGLTSIDAAGGIVEVKTIPGTTDGATPYVHVVVFQGSLAASNVAQLTIADGTTPPTGGLPSTSLEVRTRADGTSGGTGLESCTAESGCKAGLGGSGAGQIQGLGVGSIAVDAAGGVYVKEGLRVQKFDSAGRFMLMFGGEVNKTNSGNVCTAISGDTCGAGSAGTAPGQFSTGFVEGLTLGNGGQLYAADVERIQRFNLQGEFEASIPVPGETVWQVAFDPVGEDIYATFLSSDGVHKIDSVTGAPIGNKLAGFRSVATDPDGNLYVQSPTSFPEVRQYNSTGQALSPPGCCVPFSNEFGSSLIALGTNQAGDLQVAACRCEGGRDDRLITIYGPAPVMFEGPPPAAPEITTQFTTSADRTDATIKAEISPNFHTSARFYVEYGTGKCSEGGCTAVKPPPPGSLLSSKATDNAVTATVFLEGLKPGTTYHYRFVAESLGGGPVRGIGGKVGADGEESTFITYPAAAPLKTDCPNQEFRTGFSAPLADCRAYELISPIDKNNGDIQSLLAPLGFNTALTQSSSDGERFTYTSYRSFADPKSSAYAMQYMASRQGGVGWTNEAINPPLGDAAAKQILESSLDATFKAFSPDLCSGWLSVATEPVLVPGVAEGYRQLYRHDNCGGEGYEGLVAAQPTTEPKDFNTEFQGASADGRKTILRVRDKLTPNAAGNAWQAYYSSNDGLLRLLCVLPSGAPTGGNCSGGTSGKGGSAIQYLSRYASLTNAISADGKRVYWTDSGTDETGPGKIYLRLNPGEEETASGECDEAESEKACTVEVSGTASTKAARFLGASEDGARALFEVTEGILAGSLYRFDLEAGASTLIASKTIGVAGASEDLSHVYFVSEEALPETSGASAGKPNLYLDVEGTTTFIGTLSDVDVDTQAAYGSGIPTNLASEPVFHVSRVSPDGSRLAFISTRSLTGYDNTDQATGQADSEVYLYDASAERVVCVSCNPSGARPVGRQVRLYNFSPQRLPSAASIPPAQFVLQFPHSLAEGAPRVFFNSYDGLLPRDSNGKADVYQWEAASGPGDCSQKGGDLYVASSGGCLSLISSGQSPQDSEFLDASASGNDVFFTTNASLLPQDPGLVDVYDARADGGLPPPPGAPGPCQGEACQLAPPPPNDPTPASASFRGAGNAAQKKAKTRCAKGKARRKGRCIAKKQKRAKKSSGVRKANENRRSGQ